MTRYNTPLMPDGAAPIRGCAAVSTLLLLCLAVGLAPLRSRAQEPNSSPPERLTYQGYLVDANGNKLGDPNPQNYDVIFRIWNDQTSTDTSHLLWSEQQTITVNNGYFSVLLGEGSPYNSEPNGKLSDVFAGSDASQRYIEVTVKGIGTGGSDVTIQPRLRLLTSPYAFLAQKALNATTLVNSTNGTIVNVDGTALTVNGSVSANSIAGNGSALTSLNGANLINETVTSAKLANGAVNTAQIAGAAVTGAKLASGSVNTAQIVNGAVNTAQIAGAAVTGAKLASSSVNTAQIVNGAVTSDKLASEIGIGTNTPAAKLQVVGGAIMPANGNSNTAGIEFPSNPGGGSGDTAFIRYYFRTNSLYADKVSTTLAIGVNNDANDNIALLPGGLVEIGADLGDASVYVKTFGIKLLLAGSALVTSNLNVDGNILYGGSLTHSSDRRLKKNLADLKDPLGTILELHPVTFNWRREKPQYRSQPTTRQIGFIAQEVKKVLPELVSKGPDGYYGLDYTEIIPVLAGAIQQQQKVLEAKSAEIAVLKQKAAKMDGLAKQVETLKKELLAQRTAAAHWQARAQQQQESLVARERDQAARLEKLTAVVNRMRLPVEQASLH